LGRGKTWLRTGCACGRLRLRLGSKSLSFVSFIYPRTSIVILWTSTNVDSTPFYIFPGSPSCISLCLSQFCLFTPWPRPLLKTHGSQMWPQRKPPLQWSRRLPQPKTHRPFLKNVGVGVSPFFRPGRRESKTLL